MRLRFRHVLLSWAVSTICSIALAPPAVAQSFFQNLFGFGGKPSAPVQARPLGRSLPGYRFHYRDRRFRPREIAPEDDVIGPPDSGGPYRTMCARACDGFYFPLRHNAMQRDFSQDVKSCRAACGDQARLYYYPVKGGNVDTMVDLAGRPYKDMPNAYTYRKTLVSSCTCQPAPWSYEAAARHRQYAEEASELMAEAAAKARHRYEAHLQSTGAFDAQTPWHDEDDKTAASGGDGVLEAQDAAFFSQEAQSSSVVIGPPVRQATRSRHGYEYRRRVRMANGRRARYVKPQASGLFGWSLFAKPKTR